MVLHKSKVDLKTDGTAHILPASAKSQVTNQPVAAVRQSDAQKILNTLFAKTIDPAYAKFRYEQMKIDSNFDWKRPINFYGEIVDESNAPVANASANFAWGDLSEIGMSHATATSDPNGLISLLNRQGKRLYVNVTKEGYYSSGDSRNATFEYANPFDGLFRPNPNQPVIFHLRKKGEGAKLIHGLKLFGSKIDGSLSYCDLVESKNGHVPSGDLTVQFTRSGKSANKKFDWTFKLGVLNGGLIESTDEFMFLAPEDGYQPTFVIMGYSKFGAVAINYFGVFHPCRN